MDKQIPKSIMAILLIFIVLYFTGCGYLDRAWVTATGNASSVCMNNVLYYQFTSGAALAVDTNGKPIYCND